MGATSRIPSGFGPAFLNWFRERIEASWAAHEPQTLHEIACDYQTTGYPGCQWQRGTRWQPGLDEEEIAEVERRWRVRFPPDYRLFLRHLHTPDRPMLCPALRETLLPEDAQHSSLYLEEEGRYLILEAGATFSDWRNEAAMGEAFERIAAALLSGKWETAAEEDEPHSAPWPESWGARPASPVERRSRVRELVAAAPRLIPVFGSICLLAEPCQAGNPIIALPGWWDPRLEVLAPDFRTHLLAYYSHFLGIDGVRIERRISRVERERMALYRTIPFWGPILRRANLP